MALQRRERENRLGPITETPFNRFDPIYGTPALLCGLAPTTREDYLGISREAYKDMALPTDDKARKSTPIWSGFVMYFPDVFAAVAEVSRLGNEQHNPGEPLHWAREKSTDQMNTAFRHMLDYGTGVIRDTDGAYHLAKAIWRLSAELQLLIERERTYTTVQTEAITTAGHA